MSKELQKQRIPNEVHPVRSVKSIISKYLVTGAAVLALGCGAQATGNLVASLVNVPMGTTKTSTTQVIPDKNKVAETDKKEEKKTEISINELKGYQLKFKEKQGAYYDQLFENENGFYSDIGFKKPILLENGKKSVTAILSISYATEVVKKGGNDAASVLIRVYDIKEDDLAMTGKVTSGWVLDFDKLRKEYKALTGKELKYVHTIVEHDGKGKDEYIQFYVIPATSKKMVEKGIVELGMPIEILNLKYDSEADKYKLTTFSDFITSSSAPNVSNEVLVKK
ncbi:hypothetical protein H0O02_02205 [Candidatus Micrarchaeota archaeon]|nr:hypothetical protein [Candidatus Micrarchaeota archaeon]